MTDKTNSPYDVVSAAFDPMTGKGMVKFRDGQHYRFTRRERPHGRGYAWRLLSPGYGIRVTSPPRLQSVIDYIGEPNRLRLTKNQRTPLRLSLTGAWPNSMVEAHGPHGIRLEGRADELGRANLVEVVG